MGEEIVAASRPTDEIVLASLRTFNYPQQGSSPLTHTTHAKAFHTGAAKPIEFRPRNQAGPCWRGDRSLCGAVVFALVPVTVQTPFCDKFCYDKIGLS